MFRFNGSTSGLEGLEFDGEIPKDGELTIDVNGKIRLEAHNNQYCITKGYNQNEITIKDYDGNCKEEINDDGSNKTKTLDDLCDFANVGVEKEIGAKYTCELGAGPRDFYVLELSQDSKTITLILAGNYDLTKQKWCAPDGPNPQDNMLCKGDGLTSKLNEILESWSKLEKEQIGIPTATQILAADGQGEFEGNAVTLQNAWLYEFPGQEQYWKAGGYWTSTPVEGTNFAMQVDFEFHQLCFGVVIYDSAGVRPVITLKI